MVQLRIGGPQETDIDACGPDDLKKMHRALGAYLSVRNQVQLTVKSIRPEGHWIQPLGQQSNPLCG